jgi:2-polyprenyl-6-methoxyphenol hydroxylase-like FAD-dependent oxidoreductase
VALLADGRAEPADLLIGADGINSAIRTQLHGERKPRYAGYTTWRGLLDFPEDLAPSGHARKLWGPGRRFLYYRVGAGRLYWLALTRARAAGVDEPGAARAAVLGHHRDWETPVPEMIEATPEDAIERVDIADHRPLRRWGAGRVTLLGDAAHAMTPNMGQGACQAIEDAIVLARCLREGDGITGALRAYEAERRKRAAYFQRRSRMTGAMGRWRTPPAVRARDAMIRAAFNGPVTRQHAIEMRSAP